jgi:hypothetical protein
MIKQGRIRWLGALYMNGEKRNIHKTLDGNPEGNIGLSFADLGLKGR